MKAIFGDTHNFGKRVQVSRNGFVSKPRTILWEWLLLSKESKTREQIDQHFLRSIGISPFALYPDLKFDFLDSASGEVEFFSETINDLIYLNADDAFIFGLNIALLIWLGVSDLHFENIVVGRSNHHPLYFFPIDVETIFQDLFLPSQSLLVPRANMQPSMCGISRMLSNCAWSPDAVAAICKGYWDGLSLLQNFQPNILDDLNSQSKIKIERRVRVILRASQEYHDTMKDLGDSGFDQRFVPAEIEQMERGDIPYFFVESGSHDLKYFREENISASVEIQDQELRKFIERVRSPSDFWKQRRSDMRELGVLQLARTLTPAILKPYSFSNWKGMQVSQHEDSVVVETESRLLQAKIVGSAAVPRSDHIHTK